MHAGKMATHIVTVNSDFEFRTAFRLLVVRQRYARVRFHVSETVSDTTYEEMRQRIEENNRVRGRNDVIMNPRDINPVPSRQRMPIESVNQLMQTYAAMGTNFLAVFRPGNNEDLIGQALLYNIAFVIDGEE